MFRTSLLALLVLAAACTSGPSSPGPTPTPTPPPVVLGTVTGTITHAESGQPVSAAVAITVSGTTKTGAAGANGVYTLSDLPLGTGTLTVTLSNFHTHERSVTVAQTTTVNVTLTPISQPPPSPPAPTATVLGTVTSKITALPINEADIDLRITAEQRFKTKTDTLGKFTIAGVPIGVRADLRVDAAGHVSSDQPIVVDGNMAVSVPLDPVATPTPTPTPSPSPSPSPTPTPTPSPTPTPTPTPTPAPFSTLVRLVDAFTRSGISGVVVTGTGILSAASAGDGSTTVGAETSDAAPRRITISGSGFVTRETFLRIPGSAAELDLIPSSFNLAAFDEMARSGGGIERWIFRPSLIVERRVMDCTTNVQIGTSIGGTSELTPTADTGAITSNLAAAIGPLTGEVYSQFNDIQQRTSAGFMNMYQSGWITVARCSGLLASTGNAGLAMWQTTNDGYVHSAVILLDNGYDAGAGTTEQVRLRTHELGHALGYRHVNAPSIMANTSARTNWLTQFDIDAMRLAYRRIVGNRSPDVDPTPSASPNRLGIQTARHALCRGR